jgi:predicted ATPase
MQITNITVPRLSLTFSKKKPWQYNKVDLLIGPNGSGKTQVLSMLAEKFRIQSNFQRKEYLPTPDISLTLEENFLPERVITQTYSPFSRFPAAPRFTPSINRIYSEGRNVEVSYVALGLYRSPRFFVYDLSRRSLEQAIFRISETPECASIISKAMKNLGFRDSFLLRYEPAAPMRKILRGFRENGTDGIKFEIQKAYTYGNFPFQLRRELTTSSIEQLSDLMAEAFKVLDDSSFGNDMFSHEFGSYNHKNIYDYATIQSLSLFRRLGLLNLISCTLSENSGRSFDIVHASSGQQQMICSIMELAATLKNNSLVLIDEPELSLHPQWQQLYLDHLHSTLELFSGCHIIIATHSPLIVQRGRELGVGVTHLGDPLQVQETEEPQSIEGTLLNIFDTPVSNSIYLANKLFSLVSRAESEGGHIRKQAHLEITRLKLIYSGQNVSDKKSLSLINDALQLLGDNN